MLLTLLVLPALPLVTANPFNKYPYVFLLDVGNEELEKVNTEQIRLSSPGGSVALRYPAIGAGDDIAHVRVSGIDFGTDLKANILDGGPGYNYVVIVMIGNPGVAYDAVITVQTVPNEVNSDSLQTIEDKTTEKDKYRSIVSDETEEQNNSAEEYDAVESEASQAIMNTKNEELSQESSNVYTYAQNEALSGYGNENSDYGDQNEDNNNEQNNVYEQKLHGIKEADESENEVDYYNQEYSRNKEPTGKYTSDDYQAQDAVIVDQNLYNRYQALKSHFNVEVYPQNSEINDEQNNDSEASYEDYEEGDLANENLMHNDGASAVEY